MVCSNKSRKEAQVKRAEKKANQKKAANKAVFLRPE